MKDRPLIETMPRIESVRIGKKQNMPGKIGEGIIKVFLWIAAGWAIGYMHCFLAG